LEYLSIEYVSNMSTPRLKYLCTIATPSPPIIIFCHSIAPRYFIPTSLIWHHLIPIRVAHANMADLSIQQWNTNIANIVDFDTKKLPLHDFFCVCIIVIGNCTNHMFSHHMLYFFRSNIWYPIIIYKQLTVLPTQVFHY